MPDLTILEVAALFQLLCRRLINLQYHENFINVDIHGARYASNHLEDIAVENHDDKRKFPRVRILLPITVEGISFLLEKPLLVGSDVYLVFSSGKIIGEIEVPGVIIRCQPVGGKYRVVAQFTDVNDAFLMDILALVNK